jgi:hypothetical protein
MSACGKTDPIASRYGCTSLVREDMLNAADRLAPDAPGGGVGTLVIDDDDPFDPDASPGDEAQDELLAAAEALLELRNREPEPQDDDGMGELADVELDDDEPPR